LKKHSDRISNLESGSTPSYAASHHARARAVSGVSLRDGVTPIRGWFASEFSPRFRDTIRRAYGDGNGTASRLSARMHLARPRGAPIRARPFDDCGYRGARRVSLYLRRQFVTARARAHSHQNAPDTYPSNARAYINLFKARVREGGTGGGDGAIRGTGERERRRRRRRRRGSGEIPG